MLFECEQIKRIIYDKDYINLQKAGDARDIYLEYRREKNCVLILGKNPGICAVRTEGEKLYFEDVALFRSLPDTFIIDVTDLHMLEEMLKQTQNEEGIYYFRLPDEEMPSVYQLDEKFQLGRGKTLKEGNDVTIIASGVMVKTALEAAQILEQSHIKARVVDPVTIKPMDRSLVLRCARETGCIVTAENHNVHGGLGSAVTEIVTEQTPVPVLKIAVHDRPGEYGTDGSLRAAYALQTTDIIATVLKAIDLKTGKKSVQNYEDGVDFIKKKEHIPSRLVYGNPESIPNPWISYVVPTYLRADLLEETLQSILGQDEVDFPWEIVVTDNDVEDGNETEQLIRRLNHPRVMYYKHAENLSAIGNWNRAIELARGTWVAMCHADDLVMYDHLKCMAECIRKYEKGSKPLAYISPQYIEFTNKRQTDLNWGKKRYKKYEGMSEEERSYKDQFKELKPFTKWDALLTGGSVFVPSNGTIMNREIMIKTGGFNGDFGVCTDVIKPYCLASKYRVYTTLRPYGFYRFDSNATVRPGMVHKIAVGVSKLSEYIYSKNYISRIWGDIAYDERFDYIVKIMLRYARYGKYELTTEDFEDIHVCRKGFSRKWRQMLYQFVMKCYRRSHIRYLNTSEIYFEFFDSHMAATCRETDKVIKAGQNIYLYGAGEVGEKAVEYLVKHKPEYSLKGFVVSEKNGTQKMVKDYPVFSIDEIKDAESFFIVSTLPERHADIVRNLKTHGMNNYVCFI